MVPAASVGTRAPEGRGELSVTLPDGLVLRGGAGDAAALGMLVRAVLVRQEQAR